MKKKLKKLLGMIMLENINYSKIVLSTVALSASLYSSISEQDISNHENLIINKPSYDKYIDYSSEQLTTAETILKNDIDMLSKIEIDEFNKLIQEKYDTNIVSYWIPANNILDKSCLFITLKEQGKLSQKYSDLELEIFLTLKNRLSTSQLFNAIALM